MLLKGLYHFLSVSLVSHINEVDDNNATYVSQSQLPCNFLCPFKVGLIHRIFKVLAPYKLACVDVNDGEGFRFVNDEIATAFQVDLSFKQFVDLSVNAVVAEDISVPLVHLNLCLTHLVFKEFHKGGLVDYDFVNAVRKCITDCSFKKFRLLEN